MQGVGRKKFVLLDRDGTVIVNRHYQKDPAQTELLPMAREGIAMLRGAGFGIIMVSNQSGIARGLLTRAEAEAVNRSVIERLGEGKWLDGIYYCPHGPDDDCQCRKPRTGMVDRAAREHGFSPDESYVVGDSKADIELGHNIGGISVLVRTGYGEAAAAEASVKPEYTADNLEDAARWILSREAGRG